MNFEAVIGLEIHVEMKTKSKMFSSAPINFSDEPNTDTTYLDFAFPGTMPVVNKEAVRKAIQMCNALHMEIDDELKPRQVVILCRIYHHSRIHRRRRLGCPVQRWLRRRCF